MDTRTTDLAKENGSQAGGSEGARRASEELPAPATVAPDPEVVAVAKRRQFSPAYKRRIVRAADACTGTAPGEVGALLRREGLYSSHLSHWRRELEALDNGALSAKRVGPSPMRIRRTRAASRVSSAIWSACATSSNAPSRSSTRKKKLCEVLGLPTAEEPQR